jgi:DNA polymerase I-like protein with 3'-5' exonuclease and polymerase domains
MKSHTTLLFLGIREDVPYLQRLKSCVGVAKVFVLTAPVSTWTEISMYCKERNITGIFTTSLVLLKKLTGKDDAKLQNYAGSLFKRNDIEIVFVDPLPQLITVSYGAFMLRHYISKLTRPEDWITPPEFKWEVMSAENVERYYDNFKSAYLIAVDIETTQTNLAIRCCGYTAIHINNNGEFESTSFVIPVDSRFNLAWMRKFNKLPTAKIFQNGKYDIAYLSRYNAVVDNYLWDTAAAFHCWYPELPKDLASISSFFVREAMYWKDMAKTDDLYEYYKYNALDTWGTAVSMLVWFLKSPDYAKSNYLEEFPIIFPCHMAEMTGLKRDFSRLNEQRTLAEEAIIKEHSSLCKEVATPNFNTNSPKQVKQLLTILGCKDIADESSDEKHLKKAMFRHPLNIRILNRVLEIRGKRKEKSTYLRTDDDITATSKRGAKEYKGRILYSITPYATDTGRNNSSEHHFWCGLQIQNIPRGKNIKRTITADDGFMFAEADLEQAESRDTAFISGDEALISAVTGTRDFHSVNASAFFGTPYESIYDDGSKKTRDKSLRDLAKRVNHGANYNMGANVLVDTMGLDKTLEAARLLKLPKLWSFKQIAEYLLSRFHKTYPKIAGAYYPNVIQQVKTASMLKSTAKHVFVPSEGDNVGAYNFDSWYNNIKGWTRYCFGDPTANKLILNSYVAHCPQSLNAMTLNKAFMRVFYDIAINPAYSDNFKLCAQIHDSILFQFREGHEYLCEMVKVRMEIPVKLVDVSGTPREFTVPAAVKAGEDGKGSKYWSDTE